MNPSLSRVRWTRILGVTLVVLSVPAAFDYAQTQLLDTSVLYTACGLLGCAAIVLGARLHRPARPWAWYLIALGNLSFVIGDRIYLYQDTHGGVSYPGLPDVFYIAGYPFIAAGLTFLGQRVGGNRGSLIDAAIIGTSGGLLAWVFLIEPYAIDPSLTLGVKLVSVAYPIGDLILLAAVTWLLLSATRRDLAFTWLLVSTGALLVSDVIYGYQSLQGTYEGGWTDAGYILSYLAFGAAGIDHSMADLLRDSSWEPRVSRRRLLLLFAAGVMGPGVVGFATAQGHDIDIGVLTVWTILIFGLVLLRMSGLVTTIQASASRLQKQEHELRTTVDLLQRAEAARRRLLEAVLTAAENERSALAADLHDGPIQTLTTITFDADIAASELAAGNVEAAAESLEKVQKELSDQIHGLRSLMANLRPPVLDERGLPPALEDQFSSFSKRTGISAHLNVSGDRSPDAAIETIIYRVSQEALMNVAKHSGASHVTASYRNQGSLITFELHDDGVGFDPVQADVGGRDGHLGLASMRERVQLAGGQWVLTSSPGQGTTVTVRFDIEEKVGSEAARDSR